MEMLDRVGLSGVNLNGRFWPIAAIHPYSESL